MSDDYVNDGQFHEVMDRAALFVDMWVEGIQDLQATHEDPRLKEMAEEVSQALQNFYGLAGEVYFDRVESSNGKSCTGCGNVRCMMGE